MSNNTKSVDISKVTAAMATAKTEVANAIVNERKTLAACADTTKAPPPVADIERAGKVLNVAGKIEKIIATAETRIAKAMKRLEPRVKKAKKAAKAA